MATPTAARGVLELSATIAAEDLASILGRPSARAEAAAVAPAVGPPPAPVRAPAVAADTLEHNLKLLQLESLLVAEVGPTGRALFQRAKRQACQNGAPESTWLPKLRTLVLGELKDPGAWATVAASVVWIPSES
jgi:hypothetical protein